MAVGVLAFLAWNRLRYAEPASFATLGNVLVVRDVNGAELWSYTLPFHHFAEPRSSTYHSPDEGMFADLDSDGKKELLFPHRGQPATKTQSGLFYCFDHRGKVLWTFDPGRPVRTSRDTIDRPFDLRHFLLIPSPTGGKARVLITANHVPDYAMQVVLLSAKGKIIREYWHSGHLTDLKLIDANRDGRPEIWFSGIANGYKSGDVVVLDPESFDGASAEAVADYQLLGFRPPREMVRVLFPKTEVSEKLSRYGQATAVFVRNGSPGVGMTEYQDANQGAITHYVFGPDFRVQTISLADQNYAVYKRFYMEGKLSTPNPEDEIPRLYREIRYLTPPSMESARR